MAVLTEEERARQEAAAKEADRKKREDEAREAARRNDAELEARYARQNVDRLAAERKAKEKAAAKADRKAQFAEGVKELAGNAARGFVNAVTGGAADTLEKFQERQKEKANPERLNPLIEEQNRKAEEHFNAASGGNTHLREGELPAGVSGARLETAGAALSNAAGAAKSAAETGAGLSSEGGIPAAETEAHTEAVRRVLESGGEFNGDTLPAVPGNGINADWHRYFKDNPGTGVDGDTFVKAGSVANTYANTGGIPLEKIVAALQGRGTVNIGGAEYSGEELVKKARADWEAQPEKGRNVWREREDFGAAPEGDGGAGETAPSPAAEPGTKPAARPPATVPGRPWVPDLNGARASGAYGNTTNAQFAAVVAGREMYAYEKKREEYNAALGLSLDNMAFDLRSQGARLAASVQNLSPEKQRAAVAEWRDKIMRNPAYSPLADGISPQEAAARAKLVNGAANTAAAQMQANSLNRQKSQALADMEAGSEAVIADVSRGVYNSSPEQAFADGLSRINAAKQHLSPQQYRAAVTGLYGGIAEGLYGTVMDEFLSDAAGEPVYGMAGADAALGRLAMAGAGFMGAALGEDAEKVFAAKADTLADGAAARVAAYNKGLLDTWNMRYSEALEAGDCGKAEEIANEWRENRQKMADAGAVTGQQYYQTRKYFGAGEASGKSGAVKSGAAAAIAKGVLPDLQSWSATGGSIGISPADALEKTARAIRETVKGPDGRPLSEEDARTTALLELSSLWAKSNEYEGFDTVPGILDTVIAGTKDYAKNTPGSDTVSLMKFAQETFFESLFSLPPDISGKEFGTRMARFSSDFVMNAAPVFDDNGSFDEKAAKGGELTVKDVEKELKTVSGFAKKYGADPNSVFGKSGIADGRFSALEGTLKDFVAGIFPKTGNYPGLPPEQVKIQFDHVTGEVYAAANAPGPGHGNISYLFKVGFAPGISGFHDKDITFTDSATGVKYRVNKHGKAEAFNVRAGDPSPEQAERIRREEGGSQ